MADDRCVHHDQLHVQFWMVALASTILGEVPVIPTQLLDELAWQSQVFVLLGESSPN